MLNKLAKYLLTASSVAPVFFTLAFLSYISKHYKFMIAYLSLGVTILLLCVLIVKYAINHNSVTNKKLTNASPADKEITNYFLTYLFPLISGPEAFMDVRIASFFALSLFFYISFSGSYSFNPLLSFWGYKYYEAEDDTGVSFVVLSKKPLLKASNNRINLIKLTDYTYIAI
ncbi:hypothetical protein [Klebsiella variicola]|uniref:hypothetical protein n=1 Tax=Klebsiella variicola TaxID=244366 RepID=UPI0001C67A58|nr:hypothetical protein [Klebsiella variicola]EFD83145.1 hypothetical protein HMPREF0485_03920 [Klebsiella variicola]HED4236993.1 hypothetical protein [Klebsiella variicola subsp. variicola]